MSEHGVLHTLLTDVVYEANKTIFHMEARTGLILRPTRHTLFLLG